METYIELNSLIVQDDIAKINFPLEDARKGAKDVGRMLESTQLLANTSKSKFVVIGTPESRTEIVNNSIKIATRSSTTQNLRNISVIRSMREEHLPV